MKKVKTRAWCGGQTPFFVLQNEEKDAQHQCHCGIIHHREHLAEHAVVDARVGSAQMGVMDVVQTFLAFHGLTAADAVGMGKRQQKHRHEYRNQYPCAYPTFVLLLFHPCKSIAFSWIAQQL